MIENRSPWGLYRYLPVLVMDGRAEERDKRERARSDGVNGSAEVNGESKQQRGQLNGEVPAQGPNGPVLRKKMLGERAPLTIYD